MFKKENNNITGVKKKKKLLNSEDRKDVLNNFKSFLELNKNTLKIDDLITTDFDLLVYAIQNNCPLPLIEFISEKCQKYRTSLNYETKQHEVPLFIAFENAIPKQRLNNTTDTTNDNNKKLYIASSEDEFNEEFINNIQIVCHDTNVNRESFNKYLKVAIKEYHNRINKLIMLLVQTSKNKTSISIRKFKKFCKDFTVDGVVKVPFNYLYDLVNENNDKEIKFLLNNNVKMYCKILSSCFYEENYETLNLLVEQGINFDKYEPNDYNEHGANINIKDNYEGKSGLMILISNNDYHDIDCMNEIKYLIDHGVEFYNNRIAITNQYDEKEKKNDFYKYLIEYDFCSPFESYVRSGNTEIIKYLINKYKTANLIDEGNKTLIQMSYKEGNSELVTYLIENGADINTKSDVGEPILMTACQNKDYEMVKYLIENGADPNITAELLYFITTLN
ncbi:ankyrin repeat-containing domain protein [Neocallimastix sp. 'constans']